MKRKDFILSARTMNLDGPAVIMGAKADDVHLSHSGRHIAKKRGESKGGRFRSRPSPLPCAKVKAGDMQSTMTRQEIERKIDELAREFAETHDPKVRKKIYRLSRGLEKMEKQSES
jgi:hypothetical protein